MLNRRLNQSGRGLNVRYLTDSRHVITMALVAALAELLSLSFCPGRRLSLENGHFGLQDIGVRMGRLLKPLARLSMSALCSLLASGHQRSGQVQLARRSTTTSARRDSPSTVS